MALQAPGRLPGRGDKRLRSWDVDVSLDELVEWDALEQFMSEMPGGSSEASASRPASGVPRVGSSDLSFGALGARGGFMGPGLSMQRSISTESVGQALGLGPGPGSAGSLVPGAWPMANGLGAAAGTLGAGLGGTPSLPSCGTGNAATLAQSLYSSWQHQGAFPLQALPMERGVSWGAELLPFMDVGDAAGLVDPAALGRESPTTSAETQVHAIQPTGVVVGSALGAQQLQSANGAAAEDGGQQRTVQKQRFVWTSELHRLP